MTEFFTENLSTILVGAAVAALLVFVAVKMIRDKKRGKSTCGCNCGDCPASGMCHSAEPPPQ